MKFVVAIIMFLCLCGIASAQTPDSDGYITIPATSCVWLQGDSQPVPGQGAVNLDYSQNPPADYLMSDGSVMTRQAYEEKIHRVGLLFIGFNVFDATRTYYAVGVAHTATEVNPLLKFVAGSPWIIPLKAVAAILIYQGYRKHLRKLQK